VLPGRLEVAAFEVEGARPLLADAPDELDVLELE
jgi:hypothetical protein